MSDEQEVEPGRLLCCEVDCVERGPQLDCSTCQGEHFFTQEDAWAINADFFAALYLAKMAIKRRRRSLRLEVRAALLGF